MGSSAYDRFGSAVRERRIALGLSQIMLADQLSMSRQNLAEIEGGRRLPHLAMARRLAKGLGWTLDDLMRFLPPDEGPQWVMDAPPLTEAPVIWTLLSGTLTVARSGGVAPHFAMDGIWDPKTSRIRDVAGAADPSRTLFVAGCDPFLSWLWQSTPHPDIVLYVFSMGSQAALAALADGVVHFAGTHLFDPQSGQYNAIVDAMRLTPRRLQYLVWEAGMMGALTAPDGWALREPGSEARALFERCRGTKADHPVVELDSHWAIARYVSTHPHLAGVGIGPVASALDLPFALWAHEPYEWVTRADWSGDPRVRAFEHWLGSPPVAQALAHIPAIEPWSPGRVIH